eukprot:TRINITY_DN80608_c0_g1_i1.p1 TRINITY_DN80608_c0_g1~~TRINITY_DN80608_c0_g1_i1.p1  ORF type:complete len:388 (-),score=109.31 TRINITY_DN80608_c0_g1_i1:63-1226(-)
MSKLSAAERRLPLLAKQFISQDFAKIDPLLPKWLSVLQEVGANQCWHKKSTFYTHLFEVYKILKLWNQPDAVSKCGLLHSAYSNSYVNLAIFHAPEDRPKVSKLLGNSLDAEELIYKFCTVNRHDLIIERILKQVQELPEEEWGKLLPPEGVTVQHIGTRKPFKISREVVLQFAVMTIADFSEQLFSWQDLLFQNGDGKLHYAGNDFTHLWPGEMKPGLWMSPLSKLGAFVRHVIEGIEDEEERENVSKAVSIPPIFDNCSCTLSEKDELAARDLYWSVITKGTGSDNDVENLQKCITLNPWAAEPRIVLAQILLYRKDFDQAHKHASDALEKLVEWGTVWDKRLDWLSWISMARVLINLSENKSHPQSSFGVLNLGLVENLRNDYD